MRRSSRNAHLNLTPRSSSLNEHLPGFNSRRFRLRRLLAILGSAILVYVLFSHFQVNSYIDSSLHSFYGEQHTQSNDASKDSKGFIGNDEAERVVFYDPHLRKSDLRMELSLSENNPSAITITVSNFHPQSSVELLLWESPLDIDAFSLCMFDVIESETGNVVPCVQKKIPRERTPKSIDFLEIAPSHAMTHEILLGRETDGSGPMLEKNKVYEFKVKKRFKGVWKANVRKVDGDYLARTGGGSGMVDWEYETNAVKLQVTQ